jgi:prepilin-type N-terminal cleavage/methylation domain-containing protein
MRITRFRANARGFTLVEIMIVVAIMGLLVTIAIPNYVKSRSNAQRQMCIENLAQIEAAKQMWGVETAKTAGDTPADADLIGSALYLTEKPKCPAGPDYNYNPIGTNAECTGGIPGHNL